MCEKNVTLINDEAISHPNIFQTVVAEARDIILFVDHYEKIKYANLAALNVYGYSSDEFSTLCLHDICAPEVRHEIADHMTTICQKGIFFRTVHLRKNGESFPVEVNVKLVHLADQTSIGVSIIRDISETVAVETALKQSEEKYRIMHENLLAIHEELTASEEELRQQYEALRISEEKFSKIFDLSPDSITITRLEDGLFVDVNSGFLRESGYTKEESFEKTALGIGLNPQERKLIVEELKSNGEVRNLETSIKHKDGRIIHCLLSARMIEIGGEEYLLSIARNINERKEIENRLRRNEERLNEILNNLPVAVSCSDKDGKILLMNQKLIDDYGYTIEDTPTVDIWNEKVFPDEEYRKARLNEWYVEMEKYKRAPIKKPVTSYGLCTCKDGTIKYTESILIIDNENFYVVINDITNRKQMEEQLHYQSSHDSLTQLHNRAFYEERVKQLQKTYSSAGLIICDIDGLKIINDTLGHCMGDMILQSVAKILRNSFRYEDLVARIGGDEFVVLLPTNSLIDLEAGSKRILNQIKEHNANNPTIPISMSIGYANSKQYPFDIVTLFKDADNNMYREKLHHRKSARNSIVLALMKALEARDFLTEEHCDRLQDTIQSFAGAIGLPENSITDLRLFAHFHDIGKVGIPENVLFKPDSLTEEEWSVMRKHCEIGYRIAMSSPDLAIIADWILKHHEWWNGKGYPSGLKGKDIPLECRMLAIVDAYYAMTNDRPYREAMSSEAAFAELKRCAGTQFDPELVEPFISMLRCDLNLA